MMNHCVVRSPWNVLRGYSVQGLDICEAHSSWSWSLVVSLVSALIIKAKSLALDS